MFPSVQLTGANAAPGPAPGILDRV